jgi:plastocyanin
MERYRFANNQYCTVPLIAFAAIVIVSQVYSVSSVFASYSNETGILSEPAGTVGQGPSTCDFPDPACTTFQCDSPEAGCSTGQDEECDSQDRGCGSTSSPDTTEGAIIPTERHCDSQDGGCGNSATGDAADEGDQCDSQDEGCGTSTTDDTTAEEDQKPTPVPEQACGDGIDNDADGQIDATDDDCGGGGGGILVPSFPGNGGGTGSPPPSPVPPQEEDPSTVGGGNNGGKIILNEDSAGHNILATIIPSNVLIPVQVNLMLPREDICNDGRDNNRNGLVDYEDQTCVGPLEAPRTTLISSDSLSKLNLNLKNGNDTKYLERDISSSASASYSAVGSNPSGPGSQQVSTIEIRILGGSNHDIRTISFHYKYSQDTVTIKNGSKVVWINEDPAGPRGINLKDAISGKTVFSHPAIPFKSSAEYTFGEPGRYVYSDIKRSALSGEIVVFG